MSKEIVSVFQVLPREKKYYTEKDMTVQEAIGPSVLDHLTGRVAYEAKQLHPVPGGRVVQREAFILERAKGKVVLDIGASGPMHEALVSAAKVCYGIDREDGPGVVGVDLDYCGDRLQTWQYYAGIGLIFCGEVIEHLSNPGQFLKRLRANYAGTETIITVPNAFSDGGRASMETGIENVNLDHVAWYSPMTLKTLLGRAGYEIEELLWYSKGRPGFTEGIIAVTR